MSNASDHTTTKVCRNCGLELPLTEYYKSPTCADGYTKDCRTCYSIVRGHIPTPKKRNVQYLSGNGLQPCSRCGIEYPPTREFFYIDGRGRLEHTCQTCRRTRRRELAQPRRNTPALKASRAAYRKRNAEHIKWYRKTHSEAYYGYALKYRQNHPERVRESHKKRQRIAFANRSILENAVALEKDRAKKLNVPNRLGVSDWINCLVYWGNHCAYCGTPPGLIKALHITIDHLVPLTMRDTSGNVPENVVPACQACNSSKSNSLLEPWLIKKFGKRKGQKILSRIMQYINSIER